MAELQEFRGDWRTGNGNAIYDDGTVVGGHLTDFYGDRFSAKNGVFLDREARDANGDTFTRVLFIGRSGDFTLSELNNDRFILNSTTAAGLANIGMSDNTLRTVAGPVDVLDQNGNIISLDVGPIPINTTDHTWVAYLQMDGTYAYTSVRGQYRTNGEVQRVYGPAYRLADPIEASTLAITKSLYVNHYDRIRQFAIDNNILDDNGDPDLSGAIREIMRIGDFSKLVFESRNVLER